MVSRRRQSKLVSILRTSGFRFSDTLDEVLHVQPLVACLVDSAVQYLKDTCDDNALVAKLRVVASALSRSREGRLPRITDVAVLLDLEGCHVKLTPCTVRRLIVLSVGARKKNIDVSAKLHFQLPICKCARRFG